ncbi:TPA: SAM-dependent DNA methyltransferase [bacterium]|nr:SAM-dependent DNA methyltransferase [bacterium]
MSISTVVKSIQDIMRQDSGVDGDAQRISQLTWMMFLKIFDDKETEYELQDTFYKSPIPDNLRWRNWASNDEGITGDKLLDFINNDLFNTLKEMSIGPDSDPKGRIVRDIFADSYNYMKSGTLIRQVVNKINQIDFNSMTDRHLFNDIYEKILRDLQNAGNAGEYYTPRAVTQFIADMVNPKLGEIVLDPACGTGGFLICALENMMKQAKGANDLDILKESIRGIEKKPLPHMLCITNMILHDIEIPLVERDNSLSRRPYRDYSDADRVDCIITNPPFGGTEEPGIESNFPQNFQTKETADLFLVMIMKLLKNGGRAGVVLPDGFLFGEGVKTRIKESLMEECNLHTIVRLPNGVFSPYTDIQTNLLFFTKGEPTKEIWYFEHPLPESYKKYTKTKPIQHSEFELEKSWWNDRKENDYAWKVSAEEIKNRNFNLDVSNPNKADESAELSKEKIIQKLEDNLAKTIELIESIKRAF